MGMIVKLLRVPVTQLEAYRQDASLLEAKIYSESDATMISMDKSWEGILFLLTGLGLKRNTHPLYRVLFSGENIGADLGYGPAEYLLPEEVKVFDSALSKLTIEELTERFDPLRMQELHIYPEIWEEENVVYYLLAFFMELQVFYATAAENDEAIITALI